MRENRTHGSVGGGESPLPNHSPFYWSCAASGLLRLQCAQLVQDLLVIPFPSTHSLVGDAALWVDDIGGRQAAYRPVGDGGGVLIEQ